MGRSWKDEQKIFSKKSNAKSMKKKHKHKRGWKRRGGNLPKTEREKVNIKQDESDKTVEAKGMIKVQKKPAVNKSKSDLRT